MRLTPAVIRSKLGYFSMEIGLDPRIRTYSGGLGVLAGDTLRSAADLHAPMVGVTLLHRNGYMRQSLGADGMQQDAPYPWNPAEMLEPLERQISIRIEGREVRIRAWRFMVAGVTGHTIPVYFLDTDVDGNDAWDRTLTGQLYGGDARYRLCQEVVLGVGGVAILQALGHGPDLQYHMNEGHSALLTLALLQRQTRARGLRTFTDADVEAVRSRCIFTTHTPVPAGHDKFALDLVQQVLGQEQAEVLQKLECVHEGRLNMTHVALRFSRYINGVAMLHGEVSRDMFPRFPVNAITNGVHAVHWTSAPFRKLFDQHISQWRRDNLYLRYALKIPTDEIRSTHAEAKRTLVDEIEQRTGVRFDPDAFTIGYARRATVYKRGNLIFSDTDRLRRISREVGKLQLVYAGKAHPQDAAGKEMIRSIFEAGEELRGDVEIVFLENYDMNLALKYVAGVDLWLNTPRRPQEASGTSGMKAALNGVPSLSVLDGWWVEGHQEGVTGWAFGDCPGCDADTPGEIASLYDKLENVIVPLYYGKQEEFAHVMRNAIALNGSFFNTQRMLLQYLTNAYFPPDHQPAVPQPEAAPARG
ncbi:MAG: alpha-glucan family phosphorylase [Candidatus Latescibacterota bacterium]|nr:MAG: alpha-glucan family phosphorylase [Candidatus Latescibacterota bacterium]